jgi:hypothetical protein
MPAIRNIGTVCETLARVKAKASSAIDESANVDLTIKELAVRGKET